jgi:hypothetical protein
VIPSSSHRAGTALGIVTIGALKEWWFFYFFICYIRLERTIPGDNLSKRFLGKRKFLSDVVGD